MTDGSLLSCFDSSARKRCFNSFDSAMMSFTCESKSSMLR